MVFRKSLFGPMSFYKKCFAIALPVMAQQFIQTLVSLVDNFMVAALGDVKMSGVNVCGQICFIFIILMNTINYAGGIFMSQFNGAKDEKSMAQIFRFKLIVGLILAAAFCALSVAIPRKMTAVMLSGNSQADLILAESEKYMRALAFSWIPAVVSGAIATSLREIGRVKPPLVISVSATVVNTFFNYMLIYGHFGAPRLEVVGAAIATIIARVVEMIAFIVFISKTRPPFISRFCDILKIRPSLFAQIFRKSAAVLTTEMTWVLCETITTALFNSRGGAEVVAGISAGFNMSNLLVACFGGIFTMTGVIVGGELGANRLREAESEARWILSGSPFMGLFATLVGLAASLFIPVVFSNLSGAAQVSARNMLLLFAAYMPLWSLINAQIAVSRTGGDALMGVVMDISVNTLLFVPGMFALTFLTDFSPVKMYAVVKLCDFAKIAIGHLWLKRKRWLKNLTTSGE